MKNLKEYFRSFSEDVVGTDNHLLFVVWWVAIILILALGFFLNSQPVSLLGVAESREYQVNFDNPVEIKRVHVLPGQVVKKGDLLIELNQTDLESQLRILRSRFDRLSAELKLRKQISYVAKDVVSLPISADPLQVELLDTRREIEMIETRLRNLFVFAEIDGAVGAVNFKDGEKAPAFAPLVTLVPLNPSYVNGYVNENLKASVEIGQIMEVSSVGGKSVQGRVISVGARIVQIPERLLRIQTLPAWGREVVIKIPEQNGFLLGEKVSVHKSWGISLFSTAQADERTLKWEPTHVFVEDIRIPSVITDQFKPEISGITYLPEIRQFALVSDDYPESRPMLLLMNPQGEVSSQMLPIEGIGEMNDIESLSNEGSYLYMLSSLSADPKGRLNPTRQIFAKIHRDGLKFKLEEKVDLREALLNVIAESEDPILHQIRRQVDRDDLEVEGHVVQGDRLLIALKRPVLRENEGIILQVNSMQKLFATGHISRDDLKIFSRFQMSLSHSLARMSLTDIALQGDLLYVASSCHQEKCSALWSVKAGAEKAELIQELNVKKLEGVAIFEARKKIFGVFDSKKRAQFVEIPYAATKRQE